MILTEFPMTSCCCAIVHGAIVVQGCTCKVSKKSRVISYDGMT